MRIIKEGKTENKLPKFTCKNCGCEFECDKSEYWYGTDCLTSYPPQYSAYSNCPCCHKVCNTFVKADISGSTTTATNVKNEYDKTVYCADKYTYNGETSKVTLS